MTIDELKLKTIPLLKTYRVARAGLFGSAARGEMRADSDIDILIDLRKEASLFELIALKQELEETLGRRVDVVEYQNIKPILRKSILENQVILV